MANVNTVRNDEGRFTGSQFGTEPRKQDSGTGLAEKAKDAAATVAEKAQDMGSSVAHSVSDAASTVGHKAEDATSSVGGSMQSLAGTIREKGPHGGAMGTATEKVADTLESGGRYLQEQGLKGIGEDLTNVIRRNPIPAVLLSIGVGFLLARSLRR
jgi:hypothetical protein